MKKWTSYENLFDLVYADYNEPEHHFFEGPEDSTLEDFEKACDDLIPQAGYQAAVKHTARNGGWITWGNVVEALLPLLERQGYQQVLIESSEMSGGNIIGLRDGDPPDERLGFSTQMIVNYNRQMEEKLVKEREAKRALRGLKFKKKVIQIIK